ncbi:hypothetical protein E0765_05845 [Sulfuricurvum sp. IAE1]|uniref:hypothetical protein n=1 Tax=Sulfuricurvum sp. IAE1 TaxID=2546102 RepID=UPI0010457282|nr:hypothetical protein [Sulfuricurvum sp. IAE1]TDA64233.1 hypothetical protein E0765_05845 [Sulfuricurvum sp. IAE1]
MRTTKLFARFITFFLLLLFGMAIGAKSGGLDTFRFTLLILVLSGLSFLHIKTMRKKFARFNTSTLG